jgi:IS30 family transposase
LVANSPQRISAKEREAINIGLVQGKIGAQLDRELDRDPAVINREIARNGGRQDYSGVDAQARACRRPAQATHNKIADTPALLDEVRALLATGATPKQIEAALRRRPGLDSTRRVSHETIYDFIYIHANGQVKKELITHLRHKKPRRAPRQGQALRPVAQSGQHRRAPNRGRPPGGTRALGGRLGHGAGNRTAILVITEQVSRYVIIVPLGSAKNTECVSRALTKAFKSLPADLRKTLTYDKGRGMAQHAASSVAPKVAVDFCDPLCPWQRSSLENINGLIREYFPKGIDFNAVSKGQLAKAEWRLNNRPRVVLDGQSPAEVFQAATYTNGALKN